MSGTHSFSHNGWLCEDETWWQTQIDILPFPVFYKMPTIDEQRYEHIESFVIGWWGKIVLFCWWIVNWRGIKQYHNLKLSSNERKFSIGKSLRQKII